MPDTTQSPAAWEAVKGLVEMLTGHSARIAVLETENGRLRDRVDDLQSRVAMLEQCRAPTPDELERLRMVSKLVEVLVGEFARDAGAAAARQVVPRTDDLVVVAEAILRGTSADAKYAKALHELHKDMSQGQSR